MTHKTKYGNLFQRLGGSDVVYDRLEALDRLGRSDNTLVVWHADRQFYMVHWKKVAKLPRKWAKVCSKSGALIKSNCNMTDASLDVHLKVLMELNLNSTRP